MIDSSDSSTSPGFDPEQAITEARREFGEHGGVAPRSSAPQLSPSWSPA
jgi:hypothetical protein